MAAKYWIKLYHEILEDSKMGRLPDNLWRRSIELFLMAGELDSDGQLPCTGEIAWRLRLPDETLEDDLSRLEALGILTKNDEGWLVTNFAKRQAPTETIDRVRQFRQRQRAQPVPQVNNKGETDIGDVGYAQETKSYIDTDTDTDTDSSTNVEGDKSPPPAQKPKKVKATKEPAVIPEGVKVYRGLAHLYPEKALWPEIDSTVGSKAEDLQLWHDVVYGYIGSGYHKRNVKTILEYYRRREIPTTQKQNGAMNNGHNRTSQKNTGDDPAFESGGTPTTAAQLTAAWERKARRSRDHP